MNCNYCHSLRDILITHTALSSEIYKFIIFHLHINLNTSVKYSNEKTIFKCYKYINFVVKRRNKKKFHICDDFLRLHKKLISFFHIINFFQIDDMIIIDKTFKNAINLHLGVFDFDYNINFSYPFINNIEFPDKLNLSKFKFEIYNSLIKTYTFQGIIKDDSYYVIYDNSFNIDKIISKNFS